jgi:hypothetical protein
MATATATAAAPALSSAYENEETRPWEYDPRTHKHVTGVGSADSMSVTRGRELVGEVISVYSTLSSGFPKRRKEVCVMRALRTVRRSCSTPWLGERCRHLLPFLSPNRFSTSTTGSSDDERLQLPPVLGLPSPPLPAIIPPKKGIVANLIDKYSLSGQYSRIQRAEELFQAATYQANDP